MKLKFAFLPIPEELMASKAISWGAKYLFGIIAKTNLDEVKFNVKTLSERMSCGSREAKNRVKELKENKLITVRKTGRSNIYSINFELVQLVQQKEKGNECAPIVNGIGEHSVHLRGEQTGSKMNGVYKEQSLKNNMSDKPTEWNSEEETKRLLSDKQRHIRVIGIWAREMKISPDNTLQMQSFIKRNLRPAKLLIGYTDEDIVETIKIVKRTEWLKKITLETVSKFIDQTVSQKKKDGPKILRFEQIKVNGNISMRPIYSK